MRSNSWRAWISSVSPLAFSLRRIAFLVVRNSTTDFPLVITPVISDLNLVHWHTGDWVAFLLFMLCCSSSLYLSCSGSLSLNNHFWIVLLVTSLSAYEAESYLNLVRIMKSHSRLIVFLQHFWFCLFSRILYLKVLLNLSLLRCFNITTYNLFFRKKN